MKKLFLAAVLFQLGWAGSLFSQQAEISLPVPKAMLQADDLVGEWDMTCNGRAQLSGLWRLEADGRGKIEQSMFFKSGRQTYGSREDAAIEWGVTQGYLAITIVDSVHSNVFKKGNAHVFAAESVQPDKCVLLPFNLEKQKPGMELYYMKRRKAKGP